MWSLFVIFISKKFQRRTVSAHAQLGLFCVLVAQQPFINRSSSAICWTVFGLQDLFVILTVRQRHRHMSCMCDSQISTLMVLKVYVYIFLLCIPWYFKDMSKLKRNWYDQFVMLAVLAWSCNEWKVWPWRLQKTVWSVSQRPVFFQGTYSMSKKANAADSWHVNLHMCLVSNSSCLTGIVH